MKNICVFCSSRTSTSLGFEKLADELGNIFAEKEYDLVYGGGDVGLMGLIANACLKHERKVYGVIPQTLVEWEVAHYGVTQLDIVDNMHERKQKMYDLSDSFLVLPGGLGTLDEMFEILTWRQLKLHQKRIFLLNHQGFFDYLYKHLEKCLEHGVISSENLAMVEVLECLDDFAQL